MKKRGIIKALKSQKSKLNDQLNINGYSIWHGSTLHYIENIFGKDTYAYKTFSQFRAFDIQDTASESYTKITQNLEKLLDEFVDMVKSDCYQKEIKTNFLQNLDNSILALIIGGVCTGCFLIGQFTSDIKNYDLKQENRKLSDSLRLTKTFIITKKESSPKKQLQH